MSIPAPARSAVRRPLVAGLLALLILLIAALFWPPSSRLSRSQPDPVAGFDEARERIRRMWEDESHEVIPECRTQALLHGQKTARVIVFVHGYTSCPAQFTQLGELFVKDGANVFIPAIRYHGLPDRMNARHAQLTAEDLVGYADDVVDIARGLGDSITVAGLSLGGTVAGWVAENRPDVETAVLIAPVFGYEVVPPLLALPAANLFRRLPDKFEWWDTAQREKMAPPYAYPRYSRRALAQLLLLSASVFSDSRQGAAAVSRILVITNANDTLVNNRMASRLADNWRRSGKVDVADYEFPRALRLGHDLIDPNIPGQKTGIVYSRIRELMARQ
jgi:carboxylesterase